MSTLLLVFVLLGFPSLVSALPPDSTPSRTPIAYYECRAKKDSRGFFSVDVSSVRGLDAQYRYANEGKTYAAIAIYAWLTPEAQQTVEALDGVKDSNKNRWDKILTPGSVITDTRTQTPSPSPSRTKTVTLTPSETPINSTPSCTQTSTVTMTQTMSATPTVRLSPTATRTP